MSGPPELRPATRDDLPAIQLLAEQLATHVTEPRMPQLTADAMEQFFLRADAPMRCVVAVIDRAVRGVITWMHHYDLYSGHSRVFIGDLSVHADMRGHGIGEALFSHVLDWARAHGATKVTWEVWRHNESAKRFYAKNGAAPLTEEVGYGYFLES